MKPIKHLSFGIACAATLLAATGEAHAITLTYDRQIGEPGFGFDLATGEPVPGQLFVPQGIAVQEGTEYVFVSNGRGLNPDGSFNPNIGNNINVYTNDGTFLRTVGTGVTGSNGEGLDEPADLKFDPITGNLYVGDVFNSEIDVYNPDTGEFVTSFGSFSGQSPGDIFFGPGGVDFDSEGNFYVTDFSGDTIKVYGRDGELVKTIGELGTDLGQFDGPAGIAISETTGNIYVNDQFNNRIQVLDADGNPLYAFGTEGTDPGQFNEPIGIDVDEFDNIYVADSQNNRIQIFDKDGNLLLVYGESVENPGPPALGDLPFSLNPADLQPGVFNWTGGLSYDQDNSEILVGDFFTGRVQVFDVAGQQPAPVPGGNGAATTPESSNLVGLALLGFGTMIYGWKKNLRKSVAN